MASIISLILEESLSKDRKITNNLNYLKNKYSITYMIIILIKTIVITCGLWFITFPLSIILDVKNYMKRS